MTEIIVKNPDNLSLYELKVKLTEILRPIKCYCQNIRIVDDTLVATLGFMPWKEPPFMRRHSNETITKEIGIYG